MAIIPNFATSTTYRPQAAAMPMTQAYAPPAAPRQQPAIVRTPTPAFAAAPATRAYSAPLPQFGGTPASSASRKTFSIGDSGEDGALVTAGTLGYHNANAGTWNPSTFSFERAPATAPNPAASLPQLNFGATPMPQFSGGGGGISAEAQEFSKLQGKIAQEQWALQQKMVAEAAAYDTPGRRAEAEGRATADTAIAYANARREMLTRLAGLGVNEGSGKFASLNGQIDLSQASDSVGAINNARRQVEETGYGRRVDASDFSRSSAQAGAAANTQAGLDTRAFEISRSNALDRYNAESDAWNRNRTAGLDRYQVDADNFGRNRQATIDQYGVDSTNYDRGRQEWADQFGVDDTFYNRSRQQVLDRATIDQNNARIGLADLQIRSGVNRNNALTAGETTANQYAAIGGIAQGAGWLYDNRATIASWF